MKLTGPFTQLLPLSDLPMTGAISDERLEIIAGGGVLTKDRTIIAIDDFNTLRSRYPDVQVEEISGKHVLLPGFIDCHTHICFAGNRAKDYSLRIQGKSYLEIARAGGGIWESVSQTREADAPVLTALLLERVKRHLAEGVTTIEVKSGYGLDTVNELKQLRAVSAAARATPADLIPTCLAAHLLPRDFDGTAIDYLNYLCSDLLPVLKQEKLTNRVDIFIEESAFSSDEAIHYLKAAKDMGFALTVHADQFTTGGLEVAVQMGAVSADHLEASGEREIRLLKDSGTVAVVLPGASLGLGMPYAPARKLLDAGACLAIASDWNPGSAPMGDLLMQAAVMSAAEKLGTAEILAGLTFRAAHALRLKDRGTLSPGMIADMQAYPCGDHREILYQQGKLKPVHVWKNGIQI
jgi:imidazolonepropionase